MTRRALATIVPALLAALLVAGCGGGEGAVAWRDLDLQLPDGWTVIADQPGSLYVADGVPSDDDGEAGSLEVGIQFQTVSGTSSDDWRRLVDEQGWALERDEQLSVDGIPATLLEFSSDGSDGRPPNRERVVVVPSRDLEILSQAVTVEGQQDGPEVFDDHVEQFDAVRSSIDFGAPVDAAG